MADQPDSIFEKKEQETPENKPDVNQAKTQSDGAFNDLLKQIVNEKGEQKYKTLEDALVGLKHAQEYIPKLKLEKSAEEQELAALREKVSKLESLEETVLELTNRKEEPSPDGKSLNEEDIAALIEKTLKNKQSIAVQKENTTLVVTTLKEKFGDKAEETFYSKAQEFGLSVDEMNAMAAKNPKVVLTMLGVSGEGAHKQPGFTPSTGSVNTSAIQPRTNTFIGNSDKKIMLGATTQDIAEEANNAKQLVEELHSQGLGVEVLANPKEYFKRFK